MRKLHFILFLISLAYFSSAVSFQLSVTAQGSGFVSSSPSGILCGAACVESFDSGREISLTATAQESAVFEGWSGGCSGSQQSCTIVMDSDKSVTAKFTGQVLSEYLLTVYKSGSGRGTVSSTPAGISLGVIAPYDSARFASGTQVVLTASASAGSRFDRWSGDCSGFTATCTVQLSSAKTATAVFLLSGSPDSTPSPSPEASPSSSQSSNPSPTPATQKTLVITKPSGQGIVRAWAIGRSEALCGASETECKFTYDSGASLSLDAVPVPGYDFAQWGGGCSGDVFCRLALNSNADVSAVFRKMQTGAGQGIFGNGSQPPSLLVPTPMPTPGGKQDYPLQVFVRGGGSVVSGDGRISCGSRCEAKYARNNQVPLAAKPSPGHVFVGWGGVCRGVEESDCVASIEGSSLFASTTQVQAVFEPLLHTVRVFIDGNGSGSVADGVVRTTASGRAPVVEPGRIFKISCGSSCAAQYPTGAGVSLYAYPAGESSFKKWEGDCTSTYKDGSLDVCYIGDISSSRQARAFFKGPPAPNKISIEITGLGSEQGGVELEVMAPGKPAEKKVCNSSCSFEYRPGTKVGLTPKGGVRAIFQGFSGNCLGTAQCWLTMEQPRQVAAHYSLATFNRLTVVKPKMGVVHSEDYKIDCGYNHDNCAAEYDNRSTVNLKFEAFDDGLFSKGCGGVYRGLARNGYTLVDVCWVKMDRDRTVETKFSPGQEKYIVKRALDESFNYPAYPGLKEWALQEDHPIFQRTLAEFKAGNAGSSEKDVAQWISGHWDVYYTELGVGERMRAYDANMVKSVLSAEFYDEMRKKSGLGAYIYDESNLPFRRALEMWLSVHQQSDAKKKFWDILKSSRASFMRDTGITDFLNAPAPTPIPKASKPPKINSIYPENLQIARRTSINGENLGSVKEVKINNNNVDFEFSSVGLLILTHVPWGVVLGVHKDRPATVTVTNPDGSATADLVSSSNLAANKIVIPRNAQGNPEECFGGVGKGCGGLFGVKGGESSSVLWRAGCEAEVNRERVCRVSAGSLRHDNCCVRYPSGKYCGGPGNDGKPAEENNHDGNCVTEWHEAFWDSVWGRTWEVRFSLANSPDLTPGGTRNGRYPEGEAVSTLNICAQAGQEMREEKDAAFCCSGRLDWWKKCV